uniref:Cytochrome c oxidase subunit 3 n=1 Tax=Haematomyzus elephantis TaxID=160133 RepID=A0A0R5QN16_9NEOP|nr:cytochrome c oxidase subunit 3 [Haematomyzus elephantis]
MNKKVSAKFIKLGFHSFHIVDQSPWPIILSVGVMTSISNTFILYLSDCNFMGAVTSWIATCTCAALWWRDVIRESFFQGFHSHSVMAGLSMGFILFIASEVMFFMSFFWSFFYVSLNPDIECGSVWPPAGVQSLSAFNVPLLNSILLISSGVSITWAHHALVMSNMKETAVGLGITLMLGLTFSVVQSFEYLHTSFSMADSVYGSVFFLTTGFHGIHVLVGSMFITVSLCRTILGQFSCNHHVGFEFSAWYWHFVDVVWLFLFISMYWWGS